MRGLWLVLALWPGLAAAERLPSNCQALAEGPRVTPVALSLPPEGVLRIRYLAHSEFALLTPEGVLAVTDYNGDLGNPEVVPDVVTMNHAHESHFTDSPDPRIPLVLKGWPQAGRPAYFDVELGDLRIRNVTSDTRGPFGEGAEQDFNSIFLFEAAGLCVAHLGHLHQVPNAVQRANIGRVDVLMMPVDGGFTMTQEAMIDVAEDLHARVVIPMHWFTDRSRTAFMALAATRWEVNEVQGPQFDVSLSSLPGRTTLVVLDPALFP